mgnify:CR=1 FL=1
MSDWDLSESPRAFTDRRVIVKEVQVLRRDHNLSPESSIESVAAPRRKNLDDQAKPDRFLDQFPDGAIGFWAVPR